MTKHDMELRSRRIPEGRRWILTCKRCGARDEIETHRKVDARGNYAIELVSVSGSLVGKYCDRGATAHE